MQHQSSEHLSSGPRVIRSLISAAFCQFHRIAHDHLNPGLGETMPAPGRWRLLCELQCALHFLLLLLERSRDFIGLQRLGKQHAKARVSVFRAGGMLHPSLPLKPLVVFPVDREASIFIPSHAR
jgi:hypothetical protein